MRLPLLCMLTKKKKQKRLGSRAREVEPGNKATLVAIFTYLKTNLQ